MADTKISALTAITSVVSGDLVPVVDVSDTTQGAGGSTRKITATNLLKAKGCVTVAASDSTYPIGADYQCSGTSDQVEIQAAIDEVSGNGGGVVLLLEGNYSISASVTIESNVSLRGEGWGTVLNGATGGGNFSILSFDSGVYNAGNPIVNVEIRDLKIDGSSMTQASYTTLRKGIFAQFCVRWLIHNIWVNGTLATGIGTDHMVDCVIDSCLCTDCGRGLTAPNTQYGGNGIGIGVGEMADESLLISNCTVRDIGNNGIMFEVQDDTHVFGHYNVSNFHAQGCARGVRISGVENLTFANFSILESTKQGIIFSDAPSFASTTVVSKNVLFANGMILNNTGDGVTFSNADTGDEPDSHKYEDVTFANCIIRGNGGHGIEIGAVSGQTTSRIAVNNCNVVGNTGHGLSLQGTLIDITIQNNHLDGNTAGAITNSSTSSSLRITDNDGFNPQGPASITVGASPFAYTAGPTPEVVYIRNGTVTDIAKGTTLFAETGHAIVLAPNESVTVTYSSAPTMVKDRL